MWTCGDGHIESGTLDSSLVSPFLRQFRAWKGKASPNPSSKLEKSTSGGSWGCPGRVLGHLGGLLGALGGVLGRPGEVLEPS